MQLIAILSALVAINLGIVYVGSESGKEDEPQVEGVVEVESVEAVEEDTVEVEVPQASEAQPQ